MARRAGQFFLWEKKPRRYSPGGSFDSFLLPQKATFRFVEKRTNQVRIPPGLHKSTGNSGISNEIAHL